MSHELRTPMNAVLGFTHLLMADDAQATAPPPAAPARTHPPSAGEHLMTLINNVLELSRLDGRRRRRAAARAPGPVIVQALPLVEGLAVQRRDQVTRPSRLQRARRRRRA